MPNIPLPLGSIYLNPTRQPPMHFYFNNSPPAPQANDPGDSSTGGGSSASCFSTNEYALYATANGKTIFTVATSDLRAWINPELTFADVKAMPMAALVVLREMLNTAIYDLERNR